MKLIILILIAFFSLLIVLNAATYLILAISQYAKKTGISDYVIGFLVVSVGTSLPELSTAVVSSYFGKGQLSLGDVIGANTLDVTLVLGAFLLAARSLTLKDSVINETIITVFLMSSLLIILGMDGFISRIDGAILFIAFLIYVTSILVNEGSMGTLKKDVKFKHIIKDMVTFLLALSALLLSTQIFVWSVLQFSSIFAIPVFLLGTVFLASATTLPELIISVKSVISKSTHLAFGNTFGSIIINSTFVIGVGALIKPFSVDVFPFLMSSLMMLFCIGVSYVVIMRKKLSWKHGLFLMMMYLLFVAVQVIM